MAAVTTTVQARSVFGDMQVRFVRATFTSGYTNAGETITAALCDLSEIIFVIVGGGPNLADEAVTAIYVTTNDGGTANLKIVNDAGVLEGTSDMSATVVDLMVLGK